ncbi:MAG: helix-turn-helix transcriptional regulator [Hespellia sp.]|nr:helix-turn-helix transcriptional regulator [Hespellia sp.]
MGTKPTKAINNVFCVARLEAAKYNEKLKSRDGAAELLGYASASTISDWELGISIPTPEAVLKMSDLYNAPELVNSYCRNMCPLGYDVPEVKLADIDRIAVKALSSFRKIADTKENLLDIVEDGQITDDERPRLNEILENLDELTSVAMNLKCWCEKNL